MEWFGRHPSFGTASSSKSEDDWAKGPRGWVRTTDGQSYLLYLKGGRVQTVFAHMPDTEYGRVKVWDEAGYRAWSAEVEARWLEARLASDYDDLREREAMLTDADVMAAGVAIG